MQNISKYERKIVFNNIIRMAETGYEEVNTFELVYGVNVE
jgi:hypothetical protein